MIQAPGDFKHTASLTALMQSSNLNKELNGRGYFPMEPGVLGVYTLTWHVPAQPWKTETDPGPSTGWHTRKSRREPRVRGFKNVSLDK
jgi:hypothetical protein